MSQSNLMAGESLRSDERCDRCGVRAAVKVYLRPHGTLLFCSHHADENNNLTTLVRTNHPILVVDERKPHQFVD